MSVDNLIMPLFVCEDSHKDLEIPGMPGQQRVPLKELGAKAKRLAKLGIPATAIFPVVSLAEKSAEAKEAYNPKGLVPRAIRVIKEATPDFGVITDVALDPYTADGQDGLTNKQGEILNDLTLEILCRQALCLVEAGCDVLAPSDMMDGRVGAIREALEKKGKQEYQHIPILAYSAKYASAFYGPFRAAIGSGKSLGKADKKTYQMSPTNGREAVQEAGLDAAEGADMLMVKPGNFYADVILRLKQEFNLPIFAYQVSGEYSMLCHLAAADPQARANIIMESLLALKRAGASGILTYFAEEAAEILSK